MAEYVPFFQLDFDVLNIENSDDFEESSGEVTVKDKKGSADLAATERIPILLEIQAKTTKRVTIWALLIS